MYFKALECKAILGSFPSQNKTTSEVYVGAFGLHNRLLLLMAGYTSVMVAPLWGFNQAIFVYKEIIDNL